MHMSAKFWIIIVLLVVSLLGGPVAPLSAQDPGIRSISVTGELFDAVLSPDGRIIALYESYILHNNEVIPRYLPVRLYDLETGAELLLSSQTDYATGVAFSPDGTRLASYHANGSLSIWDLTTGQEIHRFTAFPGNSHNVVYHPDGSTLLTLINSGIIGTVLVWDTNTGAIATIIRPTFDTYQAMLDATSNVLENKSLYIRIALSPDGTHMAAANVHSDVFQYDLTTGTVTQLAAGAEDEKGHLAVRSFMAYINEGRALAFYNHQQKRLVVLDATTGDQLRSVPLPDTVAAASVVMSADGERMAWVDEDERAVHLREGILWSTERVIPLPPSDASMRGHALPFLHLTPDGNKLIFSGFTMRDTGNNQLLVIDLE